MFGIVPNRQQRKRAERLARKKAVVPAGCKVIGINTQINLKAATHEAGHAVAAVAFGFAVDRVFLSEENASAETGEGPGGFIATCDFTRPIETAAVAFAGYWAERICFPNEGFSFSPSDRALAMRAIESVTSHPHHEIERMAQELAESTIRLNLGAVKDVARILLARRDLDAAALGKSLRKAD